MIPFVSEFPVPLILVNRARNKQRKKKSGVDDAGRADKNRRENA